MTNNQKYLLFVSQLATEAPALSPTTAWWPATDYSSYAIVYNCNQKLLVKKGELFDKGYL